MKNIDVTILFEMLTFLQLFRYRSDSYVNKHVTKNHILLINKIKNLLTSLIFEHKTYQNLSIGAQWTGREIIIQK